MQPTAYAYSYKYKFAKPYNPNAGNRREKVRALDKDTSVKSRLLVGLLAGLGPKGSCQPEEGQQKPPAF